MQRRRFLKFLGQTAAGVALASNVDLEKIRRFWALGGLPAATPPPEFVSVGWDPPVPDEALRIVGWKAIPSGNVRIDIQEGQPARIESDIRLIAGRDALVYVDPWSEPIQRVPLTTRKGMRFRMGVSNGPFIVDQPIDPIHELPGQMVTFDGEPVGVVTKVDGDLVTIQTSGLIKLRATTMRDLSIAT